MQQELQKEIIYNYITAFNNFDIKQMVKDLDDELTFKNTEDGMIILTTNGLNEFLKVSKKAMEFFEDRKINILEFDYIENMVTIYYNFSAVLAEDLSETIKSGDSFDVGGKSIFTFKDGKIVSIEDYS